MTDAPAPACQRWTSRRDSYRRPDEPIRTLDHEVAEIEDDARAKAKPHKIMAEATA